MNLAAVEGFGPTLVRRAQYTFGRELTEILAENPYRLTEIHGVGFLLADRAALAFGMRRRDPKRQAAAANFVLREAEDIGHTCLPLDEFAKKMAEALGEPLASCETDETVVERDGMLARKVTLAKEDQAARRVKEMLAREAPRDLAVVDDGLADDQRAALRVIQASNVFCLLGSPGTGKSFLLKAIVASNPKARIALAAPTGKAAKRMEEATGRQAKTIHRLLESGFDEKTKKFRFRRRRLNPIDADIVVIDEMSMCDIRLFADLMDALSEETRLILIGDINQLPSVGPGRVLADLTRNGAVPYCELTQLKRFDPDLLIARNCAEIREGRMPICKNSEAKDFFFMEVSSEQGIADLVVELATERLPKKYGIDANRDIITLTALRDKGLLSAKALNERLRAKLNPHAASGEKFAIGDRVIQISNDYKLDVMNGDIGTVAAKESVNLTVAFDTPERTVSEERDRQDGKPLALNLIHAWALTVHKAQGSEWPWVVIPVHGSQGGMVPTRPFIYTAISRAKVGCVIVGSKAALQATIGRVRDERRWTRLAGLLA